MGAVASSNRRFVCSRHTTSDDIVSALRSLYLSRHPGLTPIIDGRNHRSDFFHSDMQTKLDAFVARYLFVASDGAPFTLEDTDTASASDNTPSKADDAEGQIHFYTADGAPMWVDAKYASAIRRATLSTDGSVAATVDPTTASLNIFHRKSEISH